MGNCASTPKPQSNPRSGVKNTHHDKDAKRRRKKKHASNKPKKTKKREFPSSVIRVGSKVLKPVAHQNPDGTVVRRLVPQRASTYNHVHELVNMNFNGGGIVGLRNLGNTCFLNSSLQCLSNTIPLTDYFLGYDYKKEINCANFLGTKGELVKAYATLMKKIWLSCYPTIEPSSFKSRLESFAPQFEGSEQHDGQELLAFLLDGIHEDLNRVMDRPYIEQKDCDGTNDETDAMNAWQEYLLRNKSIVVDLFQGQLRNTLTCLKCKHRSIRFEPFMYLSLPISDDCESLDDCLDLFCREESLTGPNQWRCPKCKTFVDATKKFDLWMTPPILIVHLKRFKFSDDGVRSKIDKAVQFPLNEWDLQRVIKSGGNKKGLRSRSSRQALYDLYAISNHYGGLGSGHYTAHAMNRFDDQWYEFNDSQVSRVADASELGKSSQSAYVLFYNRMESTQSGGGPLIRIQSVTRPDLWPHMQTSTEPGGFRGFCRQSVAVSRKSSPTEASTTESISLSSTMPDVLESVSEDESKRSDTVREPGSGVSEALESVPE